MVVHTLEQRWEILRQIDFQKMVILAKKIIFSDEAQLDLSGYVSKIGTFRGQKTRSLTLKSCHCLVRILF